MKKTFSYFLIIVAFFIFLAQNKVSAQVCQWSPKSAVNMNGLCKPIPPAGSCTCGTPDVVTHCESDGLIYPGGADVYIECEEYTPVPPRPRPGIVSGPYLMTCPSSADITIGETLQLEARYFPDVQETSIPGMNCDNTKSGIIPYSTVTSSASWQSSRVTVATVTNSGTKGLVTGIDLGTARITARYGGLSAYSSISVVRPPLLLVCPSSTTLDIGETRNFIAKYWDSPRSGVTTCNTLGSSDVTRSADWSSDNAGIATIGNDCNFMCRLLRSGGNKGVLMGVNSGKTQITASHNGLVASASIIVSGSVGSPITATLTSDKNQVEEDETINLEWITTGNPDSCIASNGWIGSKDVNGNNEDIAVAFGALSEKTFTLTCFKTGESNALTSVTVDKITSPAEARELIIKRDSCSSGESSQFNLSEEETATLVACDKIDDTEVLATWSSEEGSCISLQNSSPSEIMTIEAVGTKLICPTFTNITASATDYADDSIPVGINADEGDVPGPKPAKPPVWQEVAP